MTYLFDGSLLLSSRLGFLHGRFGLLGFGADLERVSDANEDMSIHTTLERCLEDVLLHRGLQGEE